MPTIGGQGIDWKAVAKLSTVILTTKGKHLPTAAHDVLLADGSEQGKALLHQVLSRIARINPAAAMRMSG